MKPPMLVALFVLLSACDASSHEATDAAVLGDASAVVTLHDFMQRLTMHACETLYACCDASERSTLGVVEVDEAACETTMAHTTERADTLLGASIASGRARFDAEGAAACLAALDAGSCQELGAALGRGLAMCPLPLIPLVADGGVCTSASECISGNCPPTTDGASAHCAPMPHVGEPCSGQCVAGSFCDNHAFVCRALLAAGAACAMDYACEDGLYCPMREGAERTCVVIDRWLGH